MLPATYLYLLPAVAVFPLIRDDFRMRRVGTVQLLLWGLSACAVGLLIFGGATVLLNIVLNILFLLFSGAVLALYFRMRGRLFRRSVGCGDLLFLLCLTPLFPPVRFLYFLIVSCLAALLWWIATCRLRRYTIPFVATTGIVFMGDVLIHLFRLWLH